MPHELKGREIFAVGVWNDMEFNEADLDDIVANFDKLKEKHNVPLKFGHNEEQDITDGQPAIGWVERVYKVGEKLFADFTHMPRTVFEAIQNKLYRSVSIELLFNVDSDGAKFNHVLDAVALLGSDHPAVNSLADLDALLATRTAFTGGHRVAFETIKTGKTKSFKSKTEDNELDAKEVQKIVDDAMAPVIADNVQLKADLKAEQDKTAKFTRDKADDEKRQKEEKVKLSRQAVTEVLDAAVRVKTLTPAFRENYEKQIGLSDDERVITIDLEDVKKMFSIDEKILDDKQGLHTKPGDGDKDLENAEAELIKMTHKNRQPNETFQAAFMRTAQGEPELHKAYLDSNGEK